MTCPKCKKDRVHRAERSGTIDHIYNWFILKPYICRECKYRFHRFPSGQRGPTARMEFENRVETFRRSNGWKRTYRSLTFYGLALLLLGTAFYVYLFFRESPAY
ncbi:MAG: hypothetical protein KGN84_18800 [Acidobacteriota bacterium]|nr:hypothetical protein [Acidobacteriota bacterium]